MMGIRLCVYLYQSKTGHIQTIHLSPTHVFPTEGFFPTLATAIYLEHCGSYVWRYA